MADVPHIIAPSSGSPSLSSRMIQEQPPATTLTSDTVVFSATKAPSRQSSVVAGTASPIAAPCSSASVAYRAAPVSQQPPATLARSDAAAQMQPQLKKFRVEAPRVNGVQRLTVRVLKYGDKLGFGVRHDRYKRLQVSTIQGGDSQLQVGDTLLSVNGVDLTGQEFLAVIQQLKATPPGELEFKIERTERVRGAGVQQHTVAATGAATTESTLQTARSAPATTPVAAKKDPTSPPPLEGWPPNGTTPGRQLAAVTGFPPTTAPQTGAPPPTIPTTKGAPTNGAQQPRKRARAAQRAVTMLDDKGQPVNVTALLADLKKERAEKASLEEKNAGLRKKLQRMLIENDEVRVRAKKEVEAAQEKLKREIAEAQNQVATVRAQIRLQERSPDLARADANANELEECKAQIERLKKAEADRTGLLTTRYRGECRIAAADAQRVLDSVVGMFRTKLRQVGRMVRDSTAKTKLEVACDGVRRLTFMKLFNLAHDFAFYASPAYHSLEPVHHTLEYDQFADLFGNSLCHEERAGLFYVATAPMIVEFDPSAENVLLKCHWTEQNALRDLARNFRF